MSRHSDNTRSRSRASSIALSVASVSDIYEDEQQGTPLPKTKSNGKQPEPPIALGLSIHPYFETNDPTHPIPSTVASFEDFINLTKDPATLRKWYEFVAKIVSDDRNLFDKYFDLNKKHKELIESYNDLDKKYRQKSWAYKGIKKIYEETHVELKNAQEELAQTKLELELVNKSIQHQQRTKPTDGAISVIFEPSAPTNNAKLVNFQRNETRREKDSSPITNVQPMTNLAYREETALNWEVRGIDPSKKLTGKNSDEYGAWAYTVKEKLDTDEPIYPTDRKKIAYVLSQMRAPILYAMHPWIRDQKNLTLELLFKEIEEYLGLHLQAIEARKELRTIKMKQNESVTEYYHRIFKLWQHAETSEQDRIHQFIVTLKPAIATLLLGLKSTNMSDVMDKARRIEIKKEITDIHFKDGRNNRNRNWNNNISASNETNNNNSSNRNNNL